MTLAHTQLSNAKISLFYDPNFVDTAEEMALLPGQDVDAEASELLQLLRTAPNADPSLGGTRPRRHHLRRHDAG